jgi:hypothetical protein
MVSERLFSRSFPEFWRTVTPRLDHSFLEAMADPSSPFRERWESAYSGSAPRRQNDLVAEMAFGLYCTSISKNTEVDALSEADCETAFRQFGRVRSMSVSVRSAGRPEMWKPKLRKHAEYSERV